MRCGLLGRKLGHSYSPQIHSHLSNYSYQLFEKEPEEVKAFLLSNDYDALNVTIPYKKDVIPYLDELSPVAQKMGAVNTIVRDKNGKLIGHNTDYFGFLSTIQKTGLSVSGKKVLVLGSGGAASTAIVVLRELGADVIVISRTGSDNYGNIERHADASVIINATPVGMFPNNGESPVSLDFFPNLEGVIDMIYNPARTALLLEAERRGIVAENGLWMLVAQAKESAEWFTGSTLSDSLIPLIHKKLQKQMENIVLVGMPGCGKSTVGKYLSDKTSKQFFDADQEIEKYAGESIPEIFRKYGEDRFRQIESSVLCELGKRSGCIIATGGGCITRTENYNHLHQNSAIIWLQRDLNVLPTNGRPLSQKDKLRDMYVVRSPLYAKFADYTVENNTTAQDAVDKILRLYDREE